MKICWASARPGSSPGTRTILCLPYLEQTVSKSQVLIPNELSIETVSRSPFWRMRWKVSDGWKSKSTKLESQAEAEVHARQEYTKRQILKEHGLNIEGKKVSDISKLVYQYLVDRTANGTEKTTHAYYMGIIRKYIDPIAGDWPIRGISNEKMREYDNEITKRLGRIPAKGTFNQHNIVWRMIFSFARDKKWCSVDDVPELTVKDKGVKSERRPDLSLDEYKHLRRFLRTYHLSGIKYDTVYKRKVLREYVILLIASGMRPGKEPLSLKWKDIEIQGNDPVQINLTKGKTDARPIVPMNFIKPSLRRLKEVTGRTDDNDYLFCMPDGSQLKDESGLVTRMLNDAGLRVNKNGKKRTAYSLRHTYATFLRTYRDFSFDDLSENMGNSVLMIQRHYSHSNPADRAHKFATGKEKPTVSENKIDQILSLIKGDLSDDVKNQVTAMIENAGVKDDTVFLKSFEIEVKKWNVVAEGEHETATGSNLKYVFEAAQNRYHEFMEADSIW